MAAAVIVTGSARLLAPAACRLARLPPVFDRGTGSSLR
jgi:hypothetical protein